MKHDPLLEALDRASREAPTAEARLAATNLAKTRRERIENSPARCAKHPAYESDYCPLCGTARVIGEVVAVLAEPLYAVDREETEACQAGTVGCSVDHKPGTTWGCESW